MYLSVSNISLFTLLLSASVVCAAPVADSTSVDEVPFTFTSWIDGIIADPNGPHLSPDEAFDAALRTAPQLSKRAYCKNEDEFFQRANGRDATWCLDYIARQHAQGIRCGLAANKFSVTYCTHGNAEIWGSKASTSSQSISCGDVARNGGSIFDSCWRSDDTILGQEIKYGNTNMCTTISRK